MASNRQIVLVKRAPGGMGGAGEDGSSRMVPLGDAAGVVGLLAGFNTGPDGTGPEGMGELAGVGVLYGPGFVAEFSTGVEEVGQVMVTITDEAFAWPVLIRACKAAGWKMMDPESGRTFG